MARMRKNIVVGVCAGISSYKSCYLVSLLRKENFSVKVVMTPNALHFVTPLVFETLSANPVYVDMFEREHLTHISLAEWCDLGVIAPLTANTLSKIALGISDNLLTTFICALPPHKRIILVPAMNENMWKNSIIQKNLKELKRLKRFVILEPKRGRLACRKHGVGRMAEPEEILAKIKAILKE